MFRLAPPLLVAASLADRCGRVSFRPRSETNSGCHALRHDPKFLALLLRIDHELAAQTRADECGQWQLAPARERVREVRMPRCLRKFFRGNSLDRKSVV